MSECDQDELLATRRLNGLKDGLYKEEIREYIIKPTEEQTIRILKNATHKFEIRGEELYFLKHAIINILAEREQDKKRIKELEQENYTQKIQLIENSIPVQKVKDKIKDLEYNSDYLGFEKSLEETFKIEVLEELLEEK